ncbi:GNAT family N-acetyltransferase [Burkholderia sp. Ac-20344]|nr:GNAT family N-acetyltransferase [Burkholderia sp. Ac-20344]
MADAITQQRSAERKRFFYAVECQPANGMIGSVGYTIRDSGSADCGWFLLPDFWGKGYAVPAIRELLVLAFGADGMVSMTASCSIANRFETSGSHRACRFGCIRVTSAIATTARIGAPQSNRTARPPWRDVRVPTV